jgi:hypothetical protein
MATDTPLPTPEISKPEFFQLAMTRAPVYAKQPESTQQLVSMTQIVRFRNCGTSLRIQPTLLPFGLLDSVTLTSNDADPATQFRINIQRVTGQRTSKWCPLGVPLSVADKDMSVDYDSQHEDLHVTKRNTGHDMRFRMISAQSIVSMSIDFSHAADVFEVTFAGANAIANELDIDEAAVKIAERKPVLLLFPPILPNKRFALATQAVKNMEQELVR